MSKKIVFGGYNGTDMANIAAIVSSDAVDQGAVEEFCEVCDLVLAQLRPKPVHAARIVQLSDEQARELRELGASRNIAPDMLANLVSQILKDLAIKEQEFWDSVYRVANADIKTEMVRVDYLTGQITVTHKDDTLDPRK